MTSYNLNCKFRYDLFHRTSDVRFRGGVKGAGSVLRSSNNCTFIV